MIFPRVIFRERAFTRMNLCSILLGLALLEKSAYSLRNNSRIDDSSSVCLLAILGTVYRWEVLSQSHVQPENIHVRRAEDPERAFQVLVDECVEIILRNACGRR